MLILFGDCLGGVLLFVYFTVLGVGSFGPIVTNALARSRPADLISVLPQVYVSRIYSLPLLPLC